MRQQKRMRMDVAREAALAQETQEVEQLEAQLRDKAAAVMGGR